MSLARRTVFEMSWRRKQSLGHKRRVRAGMEQRPKGPPRALRGGPFTYPGRDSNSYNTRVLGDFESPASTDSATRARARNVASTGRALNAPRASTGVEAKWSPHGCVGASRPDVAPAPAGQHTARVAPAS